MKNNHISEQGSAILYIFVLVALFGFLAYIFAYGSRGNVAMLTSERTKATATSTTQCANNLEMATKRLEARGCGAMISNAADGSNANPGAPTDGSCSIYHPNGGGIVYCP